jgi:hypothetical protein
VCLTIGQALVERREQEARGRGIQRPQVCVVGVGELDDVVGDAGPRA